MVAPFVHEQLHWGVPPLTSELIDILVDRYPPLPLGPPAGCQSHDSNYLHIVICTFEYDILASLLGRRRSHHLLANARHYQRIYEIVLADHEELLPLIRRSVTLPGPPQPDGLEINR
jgi:hypothetical protein